MPISECDHPEERGGEHSQPAFKVAHLAAGGINDQEGDMGRVAPMWKIQMGSRVCEILNFKGNVQWYHPTRDEAKAALKEKLNQSGVTYTIEDEENWFRILNEFGGEMVRVVCG